MKRNIRKGLALIITVILLYGVFHSIETVTKEEPPAKNITQGEIEGPPKEIRVSFSAVGDILMEQGMYDWMGDGYSFGSYFDDVKQYLDTDISFVNQEVVIGGEELGVLGTDYRFNAPNEIGEQIQALGFNVVNLGNNHSYDMGTEGMHNSLSFWRQYTDILTLGMYDSEEDRTSLKTIEKEGITFGFLSYISFTNIPLEEDIYRLPYFLNQDSYYMDETLQEQIRQEVTHARENCDILIVSCHWGPEFQYEPSEQQTTFASYLNHLGVDVILGHHSHGMMPVEWITNEETNHKTLVAYSLGNFVSADVIVDRSSVEAGNAYSLSSILTMDFVRQEDDTITIENITYIPLVNHFEELYTSFHLYPMKDYTEELAAKHYRHAYSDYTFTKAWMEQATWEVMDREYLDILLP